MWNLIRAGLLLLAISQDVGLVAAGEEEVGYRRAEPEAAADSGFPWLCFAISIATIVGLYVVVRRKEQAVESNLMNHHKPEIPWYCRDCARDVIGAECPRCHAPNPFHNDTG